MYPSSWANGAKNNKWMQTPAANYVTKSRETVIEQERRRTIDFYLWEARTRVLLKGYKSVSGNLFPVPDKSRGSFCRHCQSDLSRGPYQSCFQSNCLFIGIVVGVTRLCFSSCCTKIIIIIEAIKSLSVNFNGFNLTSAVLLNAAASLARGVSR